MGRYGLGGAQWGDVGTTRAQVRLNTTYGAQIHTRRTEPALVAPNVRTARR